MEGFLLRAWPQRNSGVLRAMDGVARDSAAGSWEGYWGPVFMVIGTLSIAVGCLLVALNIVGLQDRWRGNPATAGLRQYYGKIRGGAAFDLLEATRQVNQGIVHIEPRHISISENWLQYSLGLLHAPLKTTQDTERLLDGGIANCSERAQILKSIAEAAGIPSRFVGLDGHVVLEVLQDNQWRMADPDYGVAFEFSVPQLARLEATDLVVRRLQEQGHSADSIARYLVILQSADNNVTMPVGTAISPRLHAIEQFCFWSAWLFPFALLALGVVAGRQGLLSCWPLVGRLKRDDRHRRLLVTYSV